jgi:hypothetical protein
VTLAINEISAPTQKVSTLGALIIRDVAALVPTVVNASVKEAIREGVQVGAFSSSEPSWIVAILLSGEKES